MNGRSFSTALSYLKGNYAMRRAGWPGYLVLHEGAIRIVWRSDLWRVWQPVQADLLAHDWELA